MLPVKIELILNSTLSINWDNNTHSEISLLELRKACPCAVCASELEDFSHSYKVYRGNEVEIEDISIVGSYAISVTWKDGHNTGIYEFQYLIDLTKNINRS